MKEGEEVEKDRGREERGRKVKASTSNDKKKIPFNLQNQFGYKVCLVLSTSMSQGETHSHL